MLVLSLYMSGGKQPLRERPFWCKIFLKYSLSKQVLYFNTCIQISGANRLRH